MDRKGIGTCSRNSEFIPCEDFELVERATLKPLKSKVSYIGLDLAVVCHEEVSSVFTELYNIA